MDRASGRPIRDAGRVGDFSGLRTEGRRPPAVESVANPAADDAVLWGRLPVARESDEPSRIGELLPLVLARYQVWRETESVGG